jgi:hypothetical protein
VNVVYGELTRCLRLRKSAKIVLVCFLVLIETFGFTLVFGCVLSRQESSEVVDPHANNSVLPSVQGVTKSNGYYNISLAFTNVTYRENLDNILVNPNSPEDVTGLIAYLNGTALDAGAPITCSLESGDSLQIDLTLPCTEFASGSTINLCVMGTHFGCGKSVVLL